MIILEIFVPCIDKTYDFKLNEDIVISELIDEVVSVICQKEQCGVVGDRENFMFFSLNSARALSMNLSLFENDIKTGDKLMLV